MVKFLLVGLWLLSITSIVAQIINATTSNVNTLTVQSVATGFVLKEDGGYVLQENGISKILLE